MSKIVQKPVINFSRGRFGYKPEAIVIHIAEGYLNGGYSWFNNPASQVSSHYMIGRNGAIWQFVQDQDTAWHAGGVNNATWSRLKKGVNPNLYTIGIEHEGFTGETWPKAMLDSSAWLIAELSKKHNIPLERHSIIGHNEINSVSRSRCPGTGVNLNVLIQNAKELLEDPRMIKELQDKIKLLESRIKGLESTVQTRNQTIENRDKEIERLNNEISDLKSNVNIDEVIKKENTSLRQEISKLQKSNDELGRRIFKLEDDIFRMRSGDKPTSTPNIWESIKNIFR